MLEQTKTPTSAYWIIFVGLISISISPILVRLAGDTPALSLAALRNVIAVLILTPLAIRDKSWSFFKLENKVKLRTVLAGILLGFHFYMFFEAIQRTTVASASVFVSITPIFLAILGYFFLKEKLSRHVLIAILVAVCGGLLIAYGDTAKNVVAKDPVLGNILALGACLFVSIYLIIGRMTRQKMSWLAYVYPMYVSSACTVLFLTLVTNTPLFGFETEVYLLCGVMAIGPHILGHGSFNYAVKYFSATFLGLLSLSEPIGATFMAFVLFDELPGMVSIIGMVLTLIGVCIALYPGLKRIRVEPENPLSEAA
ncbi:MAG: DMT family transporter [Rhodothermales bacterium]